MTGTERKRGYCAVAEMSVDEPFDNDPSDSALFTLPVDDGMVPLTNAVQ